MAIDAMDVESPHTPRDSERKRKHKHKDKHKDSPSKKRKHESIDGVKKSKKAKGKSKTAVNESHAQTQAQSADDSPYTLTTATLYLPLSPISISPTHALASLLAEHLSPLLLTYYPPLKGVVLAYSNASISSTPPASSPSTTQDQNPQPLTLATTANEYGVLYVYLTATFLVFRPQRGQILEGWVNVQSEGFLGAVVLNLFSVGIERKRLPTNWKWIPPGEADNRKNLSAPTSEDESSTSPVFDPEKEHFKPVTLPSDENPLADALQGPVDDPDAVEGSFQSVSGHRVHGTVRFRVVDVDVVPGTERERGFLSIEGTMLSPEEEAAVVQDERNGGISTPRRGQSPSMSGAQSPQPEESRKEPKAGEEKGKDDKKSKKKKKRKESQE